MAAFRKTALISRPLFFSRGSPGVISPAAYGQASLRGVAVNPAGKIDGNLSRIAKIAVKGDLQIPIPPGSGNRHLRAPADGAIHLKRLVRSQQT